MRPIPQAAIDLVRDQEETHLFVYDDAFYPPREAKIGDQIQGHLTAGTGHTGDDVIIGMAVTAEMDAAWLLTDLNIAAGRIAMRIGADIVAELTDNQFSALLDFTFNLGADPAWTIWKRLKAKKFDQVPLEMAKFVNSGGKKLQGLVVRRNAEIALWSLGEPGSTEAPASSSIMRTSATPPTPSDPVAPGKSKALIASAVAVVSGAPPMIDQVIHTVTPYAEHSHYVEVMLGGLGLAGAVCAGLTVLFIWINKKQARN